MSTTRLYFLHALSPLHAGTGQGTGVIDLPVAREKATGIPYLPGSSVKGTLRDSDKIGMKKIIFGPDIQNDEEPSEHAGAVQFADARLLLLPVRSLRGTFAWITSPYVLNRFAREARDAGFSDVPQPVAQPVANGEQAACLVAQQTAILYTDQQVIIEDLDLVATASAAAAEWARWIGTRAFPNDPTWQQMLRDRICIVHDDLFSFLLSTATEVVARVRLQDDTKTVAKGALWYEESLPVESLLAGLLLVNPPRQHITQHDNIISELENVSDTTLQFGGKATVGRGLCRVQLVGEST